jgi:hypothetical protein
MNPFVVLKGLKPKQRQKCLLHKKITGGKKSGFDTRS